MWEYNIWVTHNIQTVYRVCSMHHRLHYVWTVISRPYLVLWPPPQCLLIHVCMSAPACWMGEGGMNEGHGVLRKNGRLPNAAQGGTQDGKCEQPESVSELAWFRCFCAMENIDSFETTFSKHACKQEVYFSMSCWGSEELWAFLGLICETQTSWLANLFKFLFCEFT